MKRSSKILLSIAGFLLVLAVGSRIYLDHVARSEGHAVRAFVDFSMERISDAARLLTEADYVGRYDGAHASFIFRTASQPESPTTVPESELSAFVRTATAATPKLIIIYQAFEFPVPADKAAFEARVRTVLESAGASVTFVVSSPAQSGESLFQ